MGTPIADNLWTNEADPRLMGGKLPSGEVIFPMPEGDAAEGVEPYPLSRTGKLWSFTSQGFRPKSPYEGPGEGPHDFKPYLVGYVELPGEVIVESLLVDADLEDLELGMAMEFAVVPFNDQHTTFAFRPEK
ncbi:Zn-ribbon domain-containing OB-fold protein [Altererythrobacter sp. MF3-039]|uniref:Zn-ribbon domain-containing OB-fold protein n=1 Tax=Altererythrobacter sp. MF3-039 TaxID=3252901 RepID=UPI00390C666C